MPDNSESQRRLSEKKGGRGRPFSPGQSGNPGGRPRSDVGRLIRERAQEGVALVDFWFQVLENKVPGLEGSAKVQDMVKVSEILADRGWGKPTQQLEHSGADGGALQIVVMTEKGEQ